MTVFISALRSFLKILFPNRCAFCGDVIELDQTICEQCGNLPSIKMPICCDCGCSKSDCTCKNRKNEYKKICAPYYYEDNAVKAVNRLKESDMPFIAKRLAADMSACIKENYSDVKFDIICYVPLSRCKINKRGYNQSQLLADEISKSINVPVSSLLYKVRENKPQKRQSEKERKLNVFGVFDVKDKAFVRDKTVLLIDDVKTTGSTLNECSKMLKIHGAKAVYAAVAAIVMHKTPK